MAEDAVATGAGEPGPPAPEGTREVGRWQAWRDSRGEVWTALTGRMTVWAFGTPIKVTIYPRAARACIGAGLALLGWIAWQVRALPEIAHYLRILAQKELLK